MLTNSLSPTWKLTLVIASTVSPLIAWNVFVSPRTSILAMSPWEVRVVDVLRHLDVLLEEAQLVEPGDRVLQVLGDHAAIRRPIDVLLGEIELGEHGPGRLEVRGDEIQHRLAVFRLVHVSRQRDVVVQERPHGVGGLLEI